MHNKGQNGTDLQKQKRWQEYTQLYKKGRNDPENQDGVIIECEVKWALGSVTMNKAKLFQILKDNAAKVLHSIQQIWKTQQWSQDWKRSVFIPILKKSNHKECSNYCKIVLILYTSKVMLKILQARLQQYMDW